MTDKTHLRNLSEISRYLCMNKYLKENLIKVKNDNSFISLKSMKETEVVQVLGKNHEGIRKTGKVFMINILCSGVRAYKQSDIDNLKKYNPSKSEPELIKDYLTNMKDKTQTIKEGIVLAIHLSKREQSEGVFISSKSRSALFTEIKERIDDLIKSDSVLSKMSHEEVLNYLHNETVGCFESKNIPEVYVDDNGTEYIFEPPSVKCTLKESEQSVKHYFNDTPLIDPKENYYYQYGQPS